MGGKGDRAHMLERPRLLDRLSVSAHVVIWASPGAGKTTLMRQWVRREEEAGRPVRLVDGRQSSEVVAALATDQTVAVDNAEALGSRARDRLVSALDDDSGRRVIVAGRWDPLRISPMRWITTTELRNADLAFSREELHELMLSLGVSVSDIAEDDVWERTQGWAAAIALAGHVLTSSRDPEREAATLALDHQSIGDYLVDAVLGTLSEQERDVLVGSAVRPLLPAALAEAVTDQPDAGEILAGLARRNLLITDDGRDGFTFHPVLFAYLDAELRRGDPQFRARAHRRAARYFAEADRPSDALSHALAADAGALVDDILRSDGIELALRGDPIVLDLLSGRPSGIAGLLRNLIDAPHAQEFPALDTSWSVWDAASRAVADVLIDLGFRPSAVTVIADDVAAPSALQAVEAFRDFARVFLGAAGTRDATSIESAVLELHRLAELAAQERWDWLRFSALQAAVTVAMGTPQWPAAEPDLRTSLRENVTDALLRTGTGSRAVLLEASLSYLRCEPPAERTAAILRSPDFVQQHPFIAVRGRAVELLTQVGESPTWESIDRLDRFLDDAPIHDPHFLSFVVVPWLSAAVHRGNHPVLQRIAGRAQRVFGPGSIEAALAAFVLQPDHETEAALRDAVTDGTSWDPAAPTHAWLRLAVHAASRGATAKAVADLTEAVIAAHRLEWVRPFLLFDADALPLLRENAPHIGAWSAAAEDLLARANAFLGQSSQVEMNPLTPRERALLAELPVHQTVADIARRQQVSPNTVKSQLQSMYRKLGVDSRSDAVEAGRRAGLLD